MVYGSFVVVVVMLGVSLGQGTSSAAIITLCEN
jgi:hypothetical protein